MNFCDTVNTEINGHISNEEDKWLISQDNLKTEPIKTEIENGFFDVEAGEITSEDDIGVFSDAASVESMLKVELIIKDQEKIISESGKNKAKPGSDTMIKEILNRGKRKTHWKNKIYSCSECSKSFPWPGSLKVHMRTHTGIRPFECKIESCRKAFSHSSHLNRHMRTHTGVKPFKCNECDKAFSHSGDLVRHERLHSGVKPFHCNVCNKAFTQSGDVNVHMRSHTGDRPFKCTKCDRAFARSDNLKVHLLGHLELKPYTCEKCNKGFSCSSHLKRHNRSVHTDDG